MEKINLNFSVPNRNPCNMFNNLKLDEVINLIKLKHYTKEIEEDLIKNLKNRPSNSYERFLRNINSYIEKIKEKYERKKEKTSGESNNYQAE